MLAQNYYVGYSTHYTTITSTNHIVDYVAHRAKTCTILCALLIGGVITNPTDFIDKDDVGEKIMVTMWYSNSIDDVSDKSKEIGTNVIRFTRVTKRVINDVLCAICQVIRDKEAKRLAIYGTVGLLY